MEYENPDIGVRPKAIVCDIDGTLVDVRSIRHLVDRDVHDNPGGPDFAQFHSRSIDCPEFPKVVQFVNQAFSQGYVVVLVTGREERWSFLTSTWLADHHVSYQELIMRKRGDYRADTIIKSEIQRGVSLRYDVRLAIDDRQELVDLWRAVEVPTSLVTENGDLGQIDCSSIRRKLPSLKAAKIKSYSSGTICGFVMSEARKYEN